MQTIRIFSDIDETTLERLVARLADVADGEDITLQICSAGGYIFYAYGIIDYLRSRKFNLTAEILGMAASAAALIAIACNRVKMCEYASLMIHGAYALGVGTNDAGVQRANDLQVDLIKKRCPTFDPALLNKDNWFSAKRAVELGLADEIISDASSIAAICNGYLALVKSQFSDKEEIMNDLEEKKEEALPVNECGDDEVKADVSSDDLIEKLIERLDAIEHRIAVLEGEGKKADDELDDKVEEDGAIMNRRKELYAKLTQSAVSAVPAKAAVKSAPKASKLNLKSFLN